MKKKIISFILVYCLIIQIPFTGTGCMSFYAAKGHNDLSRYKDHKGKILIKLKDGTETEVPKNGIFLVEKDKTDSVETADYNSKPYEIYWMKNGRSLPFDLNESYNSAPDTSNDFWAVMDEGTGKLRKIYDNDIKEIQVQEIDQLKTGLLFSALAIPFILIISHQKPKKTTIQIPEFDWKWYY